MHRNADRKGTTSPIAVQFASACQQYLLKYICVCAEADCEYIRCKPTDPRRMILCLLKTNNYTKLVMHVRILHSGNGTRMSAFARPLYQDLHTVTRIGHLRCQCCFAKDPCWISFRVGSMHSTRQGKVRFCFVWHAYSLLKLCMSQTFLKISQQANPKTTQSELSTQNKRNFFRHSSLGSKRLPRLSCLLDLCRPWPHEAISKPLSALRDFTVRGCACFRWSWTWSTNVDQCVHA